LFGAFIAGLHGPFSPCRLSIESFFSQSKVIKKLSKKKIGWNGLKKASIESRPWLKWSCLNRLIMRKRLRNVSALGFGLIQKIWNFKFIVSKIHNSHSSKHF